MAVTALVNSIVELMAEMADDGAFGVLERHFCRQLESGVTFGAIAFD